MREPEDLRRWRLGLEPLEGTESGRWSARLLAALALLTWVTIGPDDRPWWALVGAVTVLIGDGVLAFCRWRSPGTSQDLVECCLLLVASAIFMGSGVFLAAGSSGWGRFGWTVLGLGFGYLFIRNAMDLRQLRNGRRPSVRERAGSSADELLPDAGNSGQGLGSAAGGGGGYGWPDVG